ncbi:MarR family winged helix-turn-helix transcriptional regulator [Gimibacter soli]|uniref:MarR family winged helix-turn-helix transcriptional regulator n=2 Tax=Gimibacter soli TaxID=3024400 RepID=A0AAE9XMC3_9PROT|nr:MarR family winged helix-turn-helix transcriptional regulator [Gimibacter soli]WCL52672.1 MarR family winged helix-turn-helix transcriptional regulator [Gimibacter soli]
MDEMQRNQRELRLKAFLPYRFSVLSNRISRAIADRYSEVFQLTLPEWRIMAVLGETPDLSAADVADRTAMDKVAVSRAVNRLLESGRIERHFAEDDRRRSVLALSAKGRAVYEQIVPLALDYEDRLISGLTADEQAQLTALLDKLDDVQLHAGEV